MNKKAFTLIELLAVIIILGLLLAISIPSVTKYLAQSRRKVYMNTLDSYVDGMSKMVANDELPGMYEEDTVYYVPFKCIPNEKSAGSPNGEWDYAYMLLTNNNGKKSYYLYAKDVKNIGVVGLQADKINITDIKEIDHEEEDYIGVEGKTKISIVSDTCDFVNQTVATIGVQP